MIRDWGCDLLALYVKQKAPRSFAHHGFGILKGSICRTGETEGQQQDKIEQEHIHYMLFVSRLLTYSLPTGCSEEPDFLKLNLTDFRILKKILPTYPGLRINKCLE